MRRHYFIILGLISDLEEFRLFRTINFTPCLEV